ncbi:hypothetical protein JCM6292_3599 [Bacteroides pyogenes JCM 6292]|nr:hypothetical protein JCM6292_3599 [Bacteroides pyogenes JCM 6292]
MRIYSFSGAAIGFKKRKNIAGYRRSRRRNKLVLFCLISSYAEGSFRSFRCKKDCRSPFAKEAV